MTAAPESTRASHDEILKKAAEIAPADKAKTSKARPSKRASGIEPTDVKWLWTPYIARRKVTLLDGDPGAGKSNICLDLTARITTGEPFPGHNGRGFEPRTVLYLTQEDDLDDTVVPRLIRAGADLDRVILDDGPLSLGDSGQHGPFKALVAEERPALIVLDTLSGYVSGGVDLFRENSIRPVLLKLALLARRYETSVLALRHLTKGEKSKALYLGQGSMAMVGVARSVMLAAEDPDNADRRALFHTKNNLGRKADPLGYGFEDGGRLVWHDETDLTVADIMKTEGNGAGQTKSQKAGEVIIGLLADGAKPAKVMMTVLDSHGISERTAKRAKSALAVQSVQQGGEWLWHLPAGTNVELLERLREVA